MMLRYCISLAVLCLCWQSGTATKVVVTKTNGVYNYIENYLAVPDDWIAIASYEIETHTEGWTYLEVKTNPDSPSADQSFAAGLAEGAATHQMIYDAWRNTQEGFCDRQEPGFCDRLRSYLRANFNYMQQQFKQTHSDYWTQVTYIQLQILGMQDGYNQKSQHPISIEDFLLMSLSGDVMDLASALSVKKRSKSEHEIFQDGGPNVDGHCSAIIKVLPDNADLLVSHVTWNVYQAMLRIQKKYIFPFERSLSDKSVIPGSIMSFSSYPGMIGSGDDFYLISTGLTTLETTIGNYNPKLWQYVSAQGTVPEFMRVMVANRLAVSGKEWTSIFKQYNSGTYNNQWMVVDYKLFVPGQSIK